MAGFFLFHASLLFSPASPASPAVVAAGGAGAGIFFDNAAGGWIRHGGEGQGFKKVRWRARIVEAGTGGSYEGDTVLVAAGLGSRPVLNITGIDAPVCGQLTERLATESQPPMFEQMPGAAEADFHGRQTKRGSFVFGGASGFEAFNQDKTGLRDDSPKTAPAACRGIMSCPPILSKAKIIRAWAGFIDPWADGVPVPGRVAEVPGMVVARGFPGRGFGIPPSAGHSLAEIISGGEPPVGLTELRRPLQGQKRFNACKSWVRWRCRSSLSANCHANKIKKALLSSKELFL
jgi:glycine/D-amino acid oxidase-like deaminating enzyme